jgi:hydrogenase/urease accessory protein HupE
MIWAILFAVFGIIVGFFASGDNYIVIILCALAGAVVGYAIGKNMEQDAGKE